MIANAKFSTCNKYRYRLQRPVELEGSGIVVFIMLNPSTADEIVDDPTIRRCLGFARQINAYMIDVVNLFAYKATNPKELNEQHDPVGPENDKYISDSIYGADTIICAWGTKGTLLDRDKQVYDLIVGTRRRADISCLGVTKEGHPRHPLYLSYKSTLQPFKIRT